MPTPHDLVLSRFSRNRNFPSRFIAVTRLCEQEIAADPNAL